MTLKPDVLIPTYSPYHLLWQPSACSQYLWACFSFVYSFVLFCFYILHIHEIIWYMFFLSDLFHLTLYPLGPSKSSQMTRFIFLLLSNTPLYLYEESKNYNSKRYMHPYVHRNKQITKIWKQPRCPSIDKWIKEMYHLCCFWKSNC